VKLFGAQRRETAKPLQFLELMKTSFHCGENARRCEYEASRKKFTGPMKGQFPETDEVVSCFKRDARLE
jgi:hypothetical protein